MIRYGILLVILATTTLALGDTVFKTCSEREFCKRLRNNVIDDKAKYSADISSATSADNVITVPLSNENGDKLNLLISILEGNKIRAKVQEPESTRFELGDIVIIEDLKAVEVSQSTADSALSILPKDASYPYKVVVNAGPPFTVEFYYNDILEVILDADRLLMENTDDSKAFTFKVAFPGAKRLYGLLDHAWTLSLGDSNNGSENSMDPFRLRNSDSWGYEANAPAALYGSRPVVYGHSENITAGIFLHNAAEQWIDSNTSDTNPSAYFIVERAAFDLFVLLGPTPKDIVRQFTGLTGKAHMPQIWALGYHQCRFSYKSQDDVKEVAALLDKNDFPWDAIWLDGDHTDDYRWFHWNHTTYTDPLELMNNISATDRVCVSISDPHFAVDDTYDFYIGAKGKYFTKWANGSEYQAECWPGQSSWIDFLNQEASDYYSSWFAYDKFNGTTPTLAGIWNDMNEPAIFDDSTEKTMPWEVLHGDVEHGDIHNIYGLTHVRATHKGLLDRDNNEKRPFILTRSNFAGSQRYAAMWTGDNSATWGHFANSISECMNANMIGMVFCGADIGGFIGDPSDELLQRWYQGAVWTPFFRGHSSRESKRREPYLFSDEVQEVLRNTLRLRYKHIPTFYTLFFEHTRTGDPIITPLYYQYPNVNDRDTHILVGTDILAVAVTEEAVNSVEVFLPGVRSDDIFDQNNDDWFKIDDDSWGQYKAGDTQQVPVTIDSSPVYYRAGSIIFRKDLARKSAVAAKDDAYTVYVNLNRKHAASGRLYVDDYYSFNYTDKNNYLYINVEYLTESGGLQLTTIDGDNTGINANFGSIVISELIFAETGKGSTKQTVHTKTADNVPLVNINIADAMRQQNSNKLFIKL